MTVMLHIY